MHQYYPKDNLKTLQKHLPETYQRIKTLAKQTNVTWTAINNKDFASDMDLTLCWLDMYDLLTQFPYVIRELQDSYYRVTRQNFFVKINDFNTSRIRVQIMLALYQDTNES